MKKIVFSILSFSFLLIGCTNEEGPTEIVHLDRMITNEFPNYEEVLSYTIFPEIETIQVVTVDETELNPEINNYDLKIYELENNILELKYNDQRVLFSKQSESVYEEDNTGAWFDYSVIAEDMDELNQIQKNYDKR